MENYFQMNKVNIWLRNLGLKTNICPFLIHFMQSNASLIKKLMMHNDFIGKNLYSVGRAKLSSTSVIILIKIFTVPSYFAPKSKSSSQLGWHQLRSESSEMCRRHRGCRRCGATVSHLCLCPVVTNFMHCKRKKLSDSGYCMAHCAVHMRIVKLCAALPRFNGVCACLCVVNVVNRGKGKWYSWWNLGQDKNLPPSSKSIPSTPPNSSLSWLSLLLDVIYDFSGWQNLAAFRRG